MLSGAGDVAREFRVWAGTGRGELHSLRSAVWRGDAAEVAALLSTLGTTYANAAGADGATPILLDAANLQRAEIVSVLITAGANPEAETSVGGVANIVARDADASPAGALEVLRYFIGGLHVAGKADDFDWNLYAPLDTLARTSEGGAAEVWEIQALMYERGARCATATGALCETPREWRGAEAATREDFVGDVLTLVARDFGGAVFSFSAPESSQGLTDSGWDVRAEGEEGRQNGACADAGARGGGFFGVVFGGCADGSGGEGKGLSGERLF